MRELVILLDWLSPENCPPFAGKSPPPTETNTSASDKEFTFVIAIAMK